LTLAQLPAGRRACIAEVDGEDGLRDRMHALGLRVGREVAVVRRSGLNGPLHIRVGSTDLMLRTREARLIRISTATSSI
jgi:ferrous iron transport protein A